jgi:N-acetylglutamate synthase-like GNAT family acetyltransferase
MPAIEIVDVNASNVDDLGFFCAMSKADQTGYKEKLAWVKERFQDGLRIKLIRGGGRGFIEYIPGRFAWRGIEATGYMVIHCMWVVGRARGKGQGKALLDACIRDAREAGLHGIAAVTAQREMGLVDTGFFLHHGFHVVQSTGGMDLVALKFDLAAADPRFSNDLKKKSKALGTGLTIVSSPQCPYTYEGAEQVLALARADGMRARSLRVTTLKQLHETSPSPYASFDIVCNGEVVSHLFHCMTAARLRKLVAAGKAQPVSRSAADRVGAVCHT